jgi:long-chain-fatty-acid--CoA ligase ACSBG
VDSFGKALISLGFERFDVINIVGFNAPEWFFANFGAIAAGGVPAGIYATNGPEACKYISQHSKAKVVVCDGVYQLQKYLQINKDLPELKALVMYGTETVPSDVSSKCSVPVYSFSDFLALGSNVSDDDLKARSYSWKPGETCTLIYTSGTTGPPKAVMITNDNITWTVDTLLKYTPRGYMDYKDVMISFLPLSHIAAQMIDMHGPMKTGFQIYFAQPDALKGSLGATLKEVRPTAFFGVPRVWEKIYGTDANAGIDPPIASIVDRNSFSHFLLL